MRLLINEPENASTRLRHISWHTFHGVSPSSYPSYMWTKTPALHIELLGRPPSYLALIAAATSPRDGCGGGCRCDARGVRIASPSGVSG